jgi:hypothetical protein
MTKLDNQRVKEGAAGKIAARLSTARNHTLVRTQAERLMSMVPRDTRNITQRAFGDPIPGRSALDQKRNKS